MSAADEGKHTIGERHPQDPRRSWDGKQWHLDDDSAAATQQVKPAAAADALEHHPTSTSSPAPAPSPAASPRPKVQSKGTSTVSETQTKSLSQILAEREAAKKKKGE